MSKFTPWTDEAAEKAREEAANLAFQMSSYIEDDFESGFEVGVAWAAAQIDKCPSLYRNASHFRELWDIRRNPEDTHEAKLVGVREVNHE